MKPHHFLAVVLAGVTYGSVQAASIQGPTGISSITPGGTYSFLLPSGGTPNANSLIDGIPDDNAYVRLAQGSILPVSFTFTLTSVSSIYGVSIWNDRGAVGDGVKDFDLELYNSANDLLGTVSASLPSQVAEQQVFFGDFNTPLFFTDVKFIRMVHLSFYGTPGADPLAHQWREVAFNPNLGDIGSFSYLANSVDFVQEVPDAGASFLMLGFGLGGMAGLRRFLARNFQHV